MVSISTKDKWDAITTDLFDRIKKSTGIDFFKDMEYSNENFGDYVEWTQRERESREYNRSDHHIWAHLSSIISRPDKFHDFHIMWMLKRDLDLKGPISDVIDDVYDMFQPDLSDEQIEWHKREPEFDDDWEKKGEEFGGKKWAKWNQEGEDNNWDW